MKPQQERAKKPVKNVTGSERDEIQGEGSYEVARRNDEAARGHARSGDVEREARGVRPKTAEEARDMERAEQKGRSRASEEDPLLDDPDRIERDSRNGG